MSLKAIVWAFNQDVFPSSNKFVLVALANFCVETGKAYPSVSTICRLTGQHEETVRAALSKLVADGKIKDTGMKTGNTSQVKVYQLPDEACDLSPGKTVVFKDSPKASERHGKDPGKTPERPRKTGDGTRNKETRTRNKTEFPAIPDSLNTPEFQKAWADWIEDRKARRKPVTALAAKMNFKKLESFGVAGAIEAIGEAIANGWQGIYAPKRNGKPSKVVDFSDPSANANNPFAWLEGEGERKAAAMEADEKKAEAA